MWITYKDKNDRRLWINLDRVENASVSEKDIIFCFKENSSNYDNDDLIKIVKKTHPEIYEIIRNFLESKFECYAIN